MAKFYHLEDELQERIEWTALAMVGLGLPNSPVTITVAAPHSGGYTPTTITIPIEDIGEAAEAVRNRPMKRACEAYLGTFDQDFTPSQLSSLKAAFADFHNKLRSLMQHYPPDVGVYNHIVSMATSEVALKGFFIQDAFLGEPPPPEHAVEAVEIAQRKLYSMANIMRERQDD